MQICTSRWINSNRRLFHTLTLFKNMFAFLIKDFKYSTVSVIIGFFFKTGCEPGSYGIGCYEICSWFCKTPNCDHISGACVDGCKTGWEGMRCSQSAYNICISNFQYPREFLQIYYSIICNNDNNDNKNEEAIVYFISYLVWTSVSLV